MAKLSRDPYKGTRDFYPEDQFVQNHIFDVWKEVCHHYGFEEYNSSLLEETDLYAAKSGQEIVSQQTYSFIDRGERNVTIRPEMTPTFARMVAKKRMELPYPLRWFSIPNLWRYEQPQRGRLREHWQLNVDIAGANSLYAEAELIALSVDIMKKFGADPMNFVVKLNSRRLLSSFFTDVLKLDQDSSYALSKLIDKMHKIAKEEFKIEGMKLMSEEMFQKLLGFVQATDIKDLAHLLPVEFLQTNAGVVELNHLFDILKKQGITNTIFEPTLMRGFDYYTGIIFEIFDVNPANSRSLFGGGRYDDLVGIFGVEPISCVGFGMGDVVIKDYLETYGLMPEYKPSSMVYIGVIDEKNMGFALGLAQLLRDNNIGCAVELDVRKVDKQMKSADKMHIPYVCIIGDSEEQSGTFDLKNMSTGKAISVTLATIISQIT